MRKVLARVRPPAGQEARRRSATPAGRRPRAEPDGTPAEVLTLQRLVGNQATNLVLQRIGESPVGLVTLAGQAVPELLDAEQVAHAQAFYRAQPKRYSPAVMEQLHTHFGLPAGDEPTTGLVKHVAILQKQLGLKIDGMAGPRTLPQLFPSGLQTAESAEAFAATAADVESEWGRSPLPSLRAITITRGANDRLTAAGVPACAVDVHDLGGHVSGEFDHNSWSIFVDDDLVNGPAVDPVTHKSRIDPAMADVYHESRHAEQWFWMARMLAGRSPTPTEDALARKAEIPPNIAHRALGVPFAPGTMEAAIAEGWFDAELGAKRVDSDVARDRANAAQVAAQKAEELARDQPTEANKARAVAARKRADVLYAIYKDIPTEGDAFRAEKKVEDDLAPP